MVEHIAKDGVSSVVILGLIKQAADAGKERPKERTQENERKDGNRAIKCVVFVPKDVPGGGFGRMDVQRKRCDQSRRGGQAEDGPQPRDKENGRRQQKRQQRGTAQRTPGKTDGFHAGEPPENGHI